MISTVEFEEAQQLADLFNSEYSKTPYEKWGIPTIAERLSTDGGEVGLIELEQTMQAEFFQLNKEMEESLKDLQVNPDQEDTFLDEIEFCKNNEKLLLLRSQLTVVEWASRPGFSEYFGEHVDLDGVADIFYEAATETRARSADVARYTDLDQREDHNYYNYKYPDYPRDERVVEDPMSTDFYNPEVYNSQLSTRELNREQLSSIATGIVPGGDIPWAEDPRLTDLEFEHWVLDTYQKIGPGLVQVLNSDSEGSEDSVVEREISDIYSQLFGEGHSANMIWLELGLRMANHTWFAQQAMRARLERDDCRYSKPNCTSFNKMVDIYRTHKTGLGRWDDYHVSALYELAKDIANLFVLSDEEKVDYGKLRDVIGKK